MNIAEDLPDFLKVERFGNEHWVLKEYRDQHSAVKPVFQRWQSENFDLFINYADDLVPEKCLRFIDLQKNYTDTLTNHFKNFIPHIIGENKTEEALELAGIQENLLSQNWTSYWRNNKCGYDFTYNYQFELLDYKINFSQLTDDSGRNYQQIDYYVVNGIKEFSKRIFPDTHITESTAFHENGNTKQTYTKTDQGILIGKLINYDESGVTTKELDLDEAPFACLSHHSAIEILKGVSFNTAKCQLKLLWQVMNENYDHQYNIDAVSGELIPIIAPRDLDIEPVVAQRISFEEFLKDLLAPANFWMEDSEIIFGADSYKYCLENLANLSKDIYPFDSFDVLDKNNCFEITLSINNLRHNFTVSVTSDYFNSDLTTGINTLLRKIGSKYTFYEVHASEWGQEMGFCFLPDALADCIHAKTESLNMHQYWGQLSNKLDFP